MTVDKYNFYNIMKVATNTENDCESLTDYFANRSPLSKCASLSKQVLDSAEKTRGSYLSTLFDRLNMFADLSLCSLTSENEITFEDLAEEATAVFLQVPDERETRHALAAIVILQAYKELVQKANKYPDLTLPRPVYFILEEFGNLPAVHKLEQMITVGRSRNIWLNLVVQSYAQLAKVYDEKVAEIIKSNCNIQIFIGTTDLKTIEDFSKRCGNYTVITRNVGYNTVKADDINSNASIKERPLIYPSELQQLNSPANMGNAIVTCFGYQPIRSRYTPSFRVSAFDLEKTTEKEFRGRYFDEKKIFYDMRKRNRLYEVSEPPRPKGGVSEESIRVIVERLTDIADRCLKEVLTTDQTAALIAALNNAKYQVALRIAEEANRNANKSGELAAMDAAKNLVNDIRKLNNGVRVTLNQIGGNNSEKS
jgi:type IV secretion system protein VirD4